jgi:hypothetical protein
MPFCPAVRYYPGSGVDGSVVLKNGFAGLSERSAGGVGRPGNLTGTRPQGDRPYGGSMGTKHRGKSLSLDSVQKVVTLLLSGTELAVQLIDVISHIHG